MREPKKYVGLHAHSTFSIGDAIGLPQEHIDFAIGNGADALALTDHGNMNGVSHQQIKAADLKKKGIKFNAIPGVEAYFVDSLVSWRDAYEKAKEAGEFSKKKKTKPKEGEEEEETLDAIGDEMASTKADVEEQGGTIVEDENESKNFRIMNPVYQRNHLVLLPKNSAGLKAIFKIVSQSYKIGMHRVPRVDFDMLKENSNGNVIALSACLAGVPSKIVQEELVKSGQMGDLVACGPNVPHDFEAVQARLAEYVNKFRRTLGDENYYLEIQFNRLPLQHLLNAHILECSKRTGVKVVATSDSHYSNPQHWREREIHKAMAWASKNKAEVDKEKLPQKIEQLKCELYPKNASQMWESFIQTSEPWKEFYPNVDVVVDAIELTHDIAHSQISDVNIDKSVKLPALEKIVTCDANSLHKLIDEKHGDIEAAATKELVKLAVEGLKARKKANDQRYIDRLRYELETVKELKFSRYFLTYSKIMDITSKHMLLGNARGSAGGSLLSYVLGITQMDPIRFGLLFERFLTKKKKCLHPETYVLTDVGPCQLQYLDPSIHKVMTHVGEYRPVVSKTESEHQELVEVETEDGTVITCSPNHIWVVIRNGTKIEVKANELKETDELIELHVSERHAFKKL